MIFLELKSKVRMSINNQRVLKNQATFPKILILDISVNYFVFDNDKFRYLHLNWSENYWNAQSKTKVDNVLLFKISLIKSTQNILDLFLQLHYLVVFQVLLFKCVVIHAQLHGRTWAAAAHTQSSYNITITCLNWPIKSFIEEKTKVVTFAEKLWQGLLSIYCI